MRIAIRQYFCDIGSGSSLFNPNPTWTEADEIQFIDAYALKRPDRALAYCEFILRGGRRWDKTVNIGTLLIYAARVRSRLSRPEPIRIVANKKAVAPSVIALVL